MKLLIAGFNARPIVKSAIKAGFDVGAIDYFGDIDLLKLTKNCFSVLRQLPNKPLHRELHRKPAEYLYILSEIMIDEQNEFDGIILGSAFDRFPELIERFAKLGPKVYGNESKKFRLIRDIKKIQKIAADHGFEIPRTTIVKNSEEMREEGKNFNFPFVTRSGGGGGGAGIKIWHCLKDFHEYIESIDVDESKEYIIQEYISGKDASSSVICSKQKTKILSLNYQIIGDKNFNTPGDFSYCGNIIPFPFKEVEDSKFKNQLYTSIENMFLKLELKGSNGIDFVIKNGKCYFMEINPRMQGSIECLEYATGYNIVDLHIQSFNNDIEEIPDRPIYKRASVKTILFSNSKNNIIVKRYPKSKWIVDRSHFNTILEPGDPFCSIVLPSRNGIIGYNKALSIARKIMKMNKGID